MKNKHFKEYIRQTDLILSTFIETPKWLVVKRSILNPINNDNKCFQYSIVLSLHQEQIGKNCCTISKIKLFINKYNWENINFPPQEQDYKTLEMNNKSIALNVLEYNKQQIISHFYKSKLKRKERKTSSTINTD